MKKKWIYVILILILVLGLSLLLYPTLSNYWNSMFASRAVAMYNQTAGKLDGEEYEKLLNEAKEYNKELFENGQTLSLSDGDMLKYESLLDIDGSGMMGYIDISKIDCLLPIYHGTSEEVLQVGAGHVEWSSLPVGGKSSHSVISGHRGLPSAQLFTSLDRLVVGDTFKLCVLNEEFTYEVDQILTVEPEDITALRITEGEDYCTLVTCTPYGINTHRLLVRGHRIENAHDGKIRVVSDAIRIEPIIVASVIGIPLLIIIIVIVVCADKKRKKS